MAWAQLQDPLVLRARQRVLFHIFKKGSNYPANISNVARDLNASDGNINQYIHDLQDIGYLDIVRKRDAEYFRVTRRGQISLFPALFPRLLVLFILVLAVVLIVWAEPGLAAGRSLVSPLAVFAAGLGLAGFSVLLLWAVLRLEDYLLESKWSSSG